MPRRSNTGSNDSGGMDSRSSNTIQRPQRSSTLRSNPTSAPVAPARNGSRARSGSRRCSPSASRQNASQARSGSRRRSPPASRQNASRARSGSRRRSPPAQRQNVPQARSGSRRRSPPAQRQNVSQARSGSRRRSPPAQRQNVSQARSSSRRRSPPASRQNASRARSGSRRRLSPATGRSASRRRSPPAATRNARSASRRRSPPARSPNRPSSGRYPARTRHSPDRYNADTSSGLSRRRSQSRRALPARSRSLAARRRSASRDGQDAYASQPKRARAADSNRDGNRGSRRSVSRRSPSAEGRASSLRRPGSRVRSPGRRVTISDHVTICDDSSQRGTRETMDSVRNPISQVTRIVEGRMERQDAHRAPVPEARPPPPYELEKEINLLELPLAFLGKNSEYERIRPVVGGDKPPNNQLASNPSSPFVLKPRAVYECFATLKLVELIKSKNTRQLSSINLLEEMVDKKKFDELPQTLKDLIDLGKLSGVIDFSCAGQTFDSRAIRLAVLAVYQHLVPDNMIAKHFGYLVYLLSVSQVDFETRRHLDLEQAIKLLEVLGEGGNEAHTELKSQFDAYQKNGSKPPLSREVVHTRTAGYFRCMSAGNQDENFKKFQQDMTPAISMAIHGLWLLKNNQSDGIEVYDWMQMPPMPQITQNP